MKILLTGNCQMDGLGVFLQRALPQHEIRRLPHLATFYQEFTPEFIASEHAWADLVFFHHKHDNPQDYPTKAPKIPMSVWFQSGPFIAWTEGHTWDFLNEFKPVLREEIIIRLAVEELDMGYTQRWASCHEKMKQKEESESVPPELRISDLMERGREFQLQLTANHPTSLVFREWALRICAFLGERVRDTAVGHMEALTNPNIAGLPCEESATSGAAKHLGLMWGARPEDDESGRLITRQKLGLV